MNPHARCGVGVLTSLALGVVSNGAALGQSPRYTLDESRQWAQQPAPEGTVSDPVIDESRRALAEDRPQDARSTLDGWITANRRSGSPLLPEALLLRGDALLALDREFDALYDFEEICQKHTSSDVFPLAVERELEVAVRYANGLKLRLLGLRIGDPEDVLIELFIRVQERLPKSQAAERAAIEMAEYYYRRRDLQAAFDMYDIYLQNFPNGPNAMEARKRRILCDVGRFKGPRYNAAELINARVQIEDFAERFPAEADASGINDALSARLEESIAAQLLDSADWYLRTGDSASARFTLLRLNRDHPRTLSAERARSMLSARGWLETVDVAPASEPGTESTPSDPQNDQPSTAPPAEREDQ